MIIKDKKLKKKLDKIPDVDKNGDPIYKIADTKTETRRSGKKKESK